MPVDHLDSGLDIWEGCHDCTCDDSLRVYRCEAGGSREKEANELGKHFDGDSMVGAEDGECIEVMDA